jgi:hypothetical protein
MSAQLPSEETILEQALTFGNGAERNTYLQPECQDNPQLRPDGYML